MDSVVPLSPAGTSLKGQSLVLGGLQVALLRVVLAELTSGDGGYRTGLEG